MSITEELKTWVDAYPWRKDRDAAEARALIYRIDEAHERALAEQFDSLTVGMKPMTDENMAEGGWVRMPVDADGEYIHIGDVMDGTCPSGKHVNGTVKAIGDGVFWLVNVQFPLRPDYMRHYHEPTVEDLLADVADRAANLTGSYHEGGMKGDEYMDSMRALVAEYATKLRLADDGEEQ